MAYQLTQTEISQRIKELIQDQIGDDEEAPITPQTSLEEGLEIDSIERVELGIKLEKTFGITLPDEKIRKSSTVGDLIEIVSTATEAVNA